LNVFTEFSNQFDPALQTGVSNVISTSLSAVAPELATLLTLFVIIQGMMIMFGQYNAWAGVVAIMKAAIIGLLLTASYFSQYVQIPFTQTIPHWIATAIGGTPPGISQFDHLFSAVNHFGGLILQQASGFSGIAIRIEVTLLAAGCGFFISIGMFIWELTTGFISLVVCLGPFAILAFLFKATHGITERWVGKMIGLLMLYLLIVILLQIALASEVAFIHTVQNNPGAGVDAQIVTMVDMLIFFGMCAAMLIFLPAIAAYVGGGINSNVGAIALSPMRRFGRQSPSQTPGAKR
jgi:type IV secretion system protein VirB6